MWKTFISGTFMKFLTACLYRRNITAPPGRQQAMHLNREKRLSASILQLNQMDSQISFTSLLYIYIFHRNYKRINCIKYVSTEDTANSLTQAVSSTIIPVILFLWPSSLKKKRRKKLTFHYIPVMHSVYIHLNSQKTPVYEFPFDAGVEL